MRYEHPRSEMTPNGIYGGVGSKPAPKVWTPSTARRGRPRERVPARFRRLRIRRTKRSRMQPTPPYVLIPVLLVAIPMAFFAAVLVWHLVAELF